MNITVLIVVSTLAFCAAFLALCVGGYLLYRISRVIPDVDNRIKTALDAAETDVQKILDGMAAQQNTTIENLVKVQSEAIEKVIQNQSLVNKEYKGHLEQLLNVVGWHSKILNFDPSVMGVSNTEQPYELGTTVS